MDMKRCANPTCEAPIRTGHIKYCSRCRNLVRQQRHRDKNRRTLDTPFAIFGRPKQAKDTLAVPHGPAKLMPTTREIANSERTDRVRSRPLFVSEKNPPGLGQAPPPPTKELSEAIAERKEDEDQQRAEVEEQVRLLFKLGCRTSDYAAAVRNLRAIYLHGTTFELAYKLKAKDVSRILERNPGLQICGYVEDDGWTEYECGYFGADDPLESQSNEKSDADYAREYIDQQPGLKEIKCGHDKSFREECDVCELHGAPVSKRFGALLGSDDGDTIATWNQLSANRALARLGLSVWNEKSKNERPWGRGGSGGILDAGEDTRDRRTLDRKAGYKKVNAPDSFERTKSSDDESPFCYGQLDSNPDPDYTGKKTGSDYGKAAGSELDDAENPNRQQLDAKQDLTSVDQQINAMHDAEERISYEAFEKVKESSSERHAERVIEKACRKIESLDAGSIADDLLPTEDSEETPDSDFVDVSEEPEKSALRFKSRNINRLCVADRIIGRRFST